MTKKISGSPSRISHGVGRTAQAIPAGITGVLRRFWEFTTKTAGSFAKNLRNPEEREAEFVNIVRRDADRWS